MKVIETNVEAIRKEKDHDLKIKQELRRLKEDDLKMLNEQKRR